MREAANPPIDIFEIAATRLWAIQDAINAARAMQSSAAAQAQHEMLMVWWKQARADMDAVNALCGELEAAGA
jgi:hypothetical protein